MLECRRVRESEDFQRILDENDPMSWMICDVNDFREVAIQGSGKGGLDECITRLNPKKCQFALIKVKAIQQSSGRRCTQCKFLFISWYGSETSIIERAKMSRLAKPVQQLFGQVHLSLCANTTKDLTRDRVCNEFAKRMEGNVQTTYIFDDQVNANLQSGIETNPKQPAEGSFEDIWGQFRQQNSPLNWILFQTAMGDSHSIYKFGGGGMSEMIVNLEDQHVFYGIFKVLASSQAGSYISIRERFVFLCWVPEQTGVFARANVATQKQTLLKRLGTYHVEIRAEQREDIRREEIVKILDNACGSHKPQKYIFGPDDEVLCNV